MSQLLLRDLYLNPDLIIPGRAPIIIDNSLAQSSSASYSSEPQSVIVDCDPDPQESTDAFLRAAISRRTLAIVQSANHLDDLELLVPDEDLASIATVLDIDQVAESSPPNSTSFSYSIVATYPIWSGGILAIAGPPRDPRLYDSDSEKEDGQA